MYTSNTNPNLTTSSSTTNTISIASSNPATFTVNSVSPSHQNIETSEVFTYPDSINIAAYVLEQLTPEEEQNLFDIIGSIPAHERDAALQQLAISDTSNSMQLAKAQEEDPSEIQAMETQEAEEDIASDTAGHKFASFANETSLLDKLEIDQQQKNAFLSDLASALNKKSPKTKDEIKITIVKSLLEGKNESQIIKEYEELHCLPAVPLSETIILSMFEYYKLGGLTLLKGYPYGDMHPFPAKLMHQALTMFKQPKIRHYIEITHAIQSEIEHNHEYQGQEIPKVTYGKIIDFLKRCGVASR